jgi:hypothetical protein
MVLKHSILIHGQIQSCIPQTQPQKRVYQYAEETSMLFYLVIRLFARGQTQHLVSSIHTIPIGHSIELLPSLAQTYSHARFQAWLAPPIGVDHFTRRSSACTRVHRHTDTAEQQLPGTISHKHYLLMEYCVLLQQYGFFFTSFGVSHFFVTCNVLVRTNEFVETGILDGHIIQPDRDCNFIRSSGIEQSLN